jgi:predicted O-linked N-acetylglucosamine transferase (SPINDLY family)
MSEGPAVVADWLARAEESPDDIECWLTLGRLYHSLWDIRASRNAFLRALELDPMHTEARGVVLYFSHFEDEWPPAERHRMHCDWWRLHNAPVRTRFPNVPDPDRRLRVGYVANAFLRRPEALFLPPILECHNEAQFEVLCYTSTAGERLSRHTWRDVSELTAAGLAHLVEQDAIDILVDIIGPLDPRASEAFAGRAAPVQVSFPNYAGSTGLSTMDYRITDAVADPEGLSGHLYTEKLCRLPVLLPFAPPEHHPPVQAPPFERNGFVTFGSFNNPIKLTPELLAFWAGILAAAPTARLVIHHALGGLFEFRAGVVNRDLEARLRAPFLEAGIAPDRLAFVGGLSHWDHLDFHNEIDVMLDPFPCNGFTTTVESMWMGVPVIAWNGDSYVSRISAAFLRPCGLGDFVCADLAAYRDLAIRLAGDPGPLVALRSELRDWVRGSALMDRFGYTRGLEQAYREFWRTWCRQSPQT